MKHIRNIFIGAALALTTASCNSFLDDQPRGMAIAETTDQYNGMFQTIEFMNMSIQNYMFWLNDDIQFTDEIYKSLASTAYNYRPESIKRAFQYQGNVYEPEEKCTAWESPYKNIYTFNAIANGVMDSKGGTEAQKKAIRAEARISRAWMHFQLAQIFCPPYSEDNAGKPAIPIVTQANSMETDFKRATLKQVYDFITTELEESCPDLPDQAEHNMRVYKSTGYALLGKFYWLTGQYQKAIESLRIAYERMKADNSVIYMRDFNKIEAQYNYQELTPCQLSDENASGNRLLPYTWGNPEMLWVKQGTNFMGIYNWSGKDLATYYIKPSVYALFDEYDLRRNLIPTKDSEGNATPYPVGCIRDQTENYGVELPEIYLGLAECEAREGSQENARKLLEEFRKYRVLTGHEGIPASVQTKDDLVRFCLDEEHREFMGRVMRVWNLRRLWNDPLFQSEKPIKHSDGTNEYTLTEDKLYIDIPESVLKWNESWRQ